MLRIWGNRIFFILLTTWLVYSFSFYVLQEVFVSSRSIDYSIKFESKQKTTLLYSYNIAPAQVGSQISTIEIVEGTNELHLPLPKHKQITSIHFLVTDSVELYLEGIGLRNTRNTINLSLDQIAFEANVSTSDLDLEKPLEIVNGRILVQLNKKFTTLNFTDHILNQLNSQLTHWLKLIAIGIAFFFLIILISIFIFKKLSITITPTFNYCYVFLVIIFTPIVTQKENWSNENRELASFPDLNVNIWRIPSAYTKYYNDHFPFRNELRLMGTYIKYNIFNITPKPDVVQIGEEGWLFLSTDDTRQIYQGIVLYSEEELKTITKNLEKVEQKLASKGIHFYFMVPPLKHQIYSEYLPEGYEKINSYTKRFQLMEYMKNNSSINIIDPYNTLKQRKTDFDLYYKTDTHWNRKGAFLAYQLMVDSLSKAFPSIGVPHEFSDFEITQDYNYKGDLVTLIDLQNTFQRTSYHMSPKYESTTDGIRIGAPMLGELSFQYYNSSTADTTKPRLLLVRDSFSEYLHPVLSEHFSYTALSWSMKLDTNRINSEKPDVVVFEMMERFIDNLLVEL